MKINLSIIVCLVIVFCPFMLKAQLKYGINLKGGASSICRIEKNENYAMNEYYKLLPLFGVDGFVQERIAKSRFSFEQSISIESSGAEVWLPQKIYEGLINSGENFDMPWSFRTFQVGIPLRFKFDMDYNSSFYAGINNVFYLKRHQFYANKIYTLRGIAGLDFDVFSKYKIGIEGGFDILPSGNEANYAYYYHHYSLALKVGIFLDDLH